MTVDVAPGTVALYTDVVCAWSTVALHRFHAARSRLGLDDQVRVDLRLFLLEDVDRFAVPERMLDAGIPVVGRLEPTPGMSPWQGERSARQPMTADHRRHRDDVQGSPHFLLADGSDVHDPGIAMHPDEAGGCPVVDSDDPSVYDDLVRRAAEAAQSASGGAAS